MADDVKLLNELKPCPFCGGKADPEGWLCDDGRKGPACDQCGASAQSAEILNSRHEIDSEAPDRIWLEPEGALYPCWADHDAFNCLGVRYVRTTAAASNSLNENDAVNL